MVAIDADSRHVAVFARPTERTLHLPGQWRVRTGVFRIIYEIDDGVLVVVVVAVGHRREIYR